MFAQKDELDGDRTSALLIIRMMASFLSLSLSPLSWTSLVCLCTLFVHCPMVRSSARAILLSRQIDTHTPRPDRAINFQFTSRAVLLFYCLITFQYFTTEREKPKERKIRATVMEVSMCKWTSAMAMAVARCLSTAAVACFRGVLLRPFGMEARFARPSSGPLPPF